MKRNARQFRSRKIRKRALRLRQFGEKWRPGDLALPVRPRLFAPSVCNPLAFAASVALIQAAIRRRRVAA